MIPLLRQQILQAAENVTDPPGRVYTMNEIQRVRQLAAATAALHALRRQIDTKLSGDRYGSADWKDGVRHGLNLAFHQVDTLLAELDQEKK